MPDNEPDSALNEKPTRPRIATWLIRGTVLVAVLVLGFAALVAYWTLRPNGSAIAPGLKYDQWAAVQDGLHNSNTDLMIWRGRFYLIHASSPWHLGSTQCRLVLLRSDDARAWERVAEFSVPDQDIRDPKFAVIHDRLFLYVLKNVGLNPEPYTTAWTSSDDGTAWAPLQDAQPAGWLFWRPKTRDGITWYAPAYWNEHGKSILLASTDGVRWEEVSVIHEGDRNDETDIEFLPNGRLLATARLEITDSFFGNKSACTLIAAADPPYKQWTSTRSNVTRLDGPCLFSYDGAIYAVGRHNPDSPRPLDYYGSILGRKRTALYKVEENRLIYLSDLPSAGDTSYPGFVVRGNDLFVSYYTSRIDRDYPWIIGILSASDIRIAKIQLPSLAALAGV